MRWFLLLAAALVALAPVARADSGEQRRTPSPARAVVLVLAPALTLADLRSSDAPALSRLVQTAAVGAMPTRAGGTDALSPYRTLAAGTRSPSPGALSLGEALRAAGVRTAAIGGDGAAALAGAAPARTGWRQALDSTPDGWVTDPEQMTVAVRLAAQGGSPAFVALEFTDLRRAEEYAPYCLPAAAVQHRRDALRRLDGLMDRLTVSGECAVLLIAPEPSAAARERRERAGPVLLFHPQSDVSAGLLLTSPSTRHTPGLLANTDIGSSITALLGLTGSRIGAGRSLETMPTPGKKSPLAYLESRVRVWGAQAREQRLLQAVPWLLALALIAACFLSSAARRVLALIALMTPAALLLAPILLPAPEMPWAVYAVAAVAAGGAAFALRHADRYRAFLGAALLTALVLAVDLLSGQHLLKRSPLSYSVLEAARFYGIGNEASGVLLGSALPAAAAFGPVGASLAGIVVTFALASPALGADFGGAVAAIAGFGALLLLRRRRLRAAGVAVACLLSVALLAGFVAWDAGRPAQRRTHIGQAVAAARSEGVGALREIAVRKARMGAHLLVSSPWAVLFVTEAGLGIWLWRRRRHAAALEEKAALGAVAVAALVALAINDSGVVAAATTLLPGTAWLVLSHEKGAEDAPPPRHATIP